MMQQHGSSELESSGYRGYEGQQFSARPQVETSSEYLFTDLAGGKITPEQRTSQNQFRLSIAAMSMGTLIALVVICLLLIGGLGGWISFIVASCILLGLAITTTNGSSK